MLLFYSARPFFEGEAEMMEISSSFFFFFFAGPGFRRRPQIERFFKGGEEKEVGYGRAFGVSFF